LPLNGEGEAVEAGVNVSVKTATDTTAEGVTSDSIGASEAADNLGDICPYQAPGRLSSRIFAQAVLTQVVDSVNGQGRNQAADTLIFRRAVNH